MDASAYRSEAELFLGELDREYYLHFAGHKPDYEIEPIYERHAALFSQAAVEELRRTGEPELLEFAVEGLIGQATKAEAAELARREAALELELDGERLPFRQASVVQANEPDPDQRAELEACRLELLQSELNPLLREALERSHALARELGWQSMRALCEELSGLDLGALAAQTGEFLRVTEAGYDRLVGPQLERQLGFGFERLRRSDLPAFFRAPALDAGFPADRLVESLRRTLAGLGIDLDAQAGVTLDAERRPTKTPRAFCAPVRVPDEVYLVIAPIGGRDDYETLFHEAGHTEHYAHVARELPLERRYLGDNSFTESFAFLFEHLVHDRTWLERVLCPDDPDAVAAHARAAKLVFLRRYSAKLAYELALHGDTRSPESLRAEYARRLSDAVHVEWPAVTWLQDVDAFFYSARYLRAWALETRVRALLRERFGEAWFESPEAGALLAEVWREGQPRLAEALLERLGEPPRIDFGWLAEEVAAAA